MNLKQWLIRKLGGIVINDLPLHIQVKIFEHSNNQLYNCQIDNLRLGCLCIPPCSCQEEFEKMKREMV